MVFISDQELKELFEAAMPILRTSRGTNIIIIGPLPRYALDHITNFNDEAYSTEMAARLKEIAKNIKNRIFNLWLKGVLVNPIALMGNTREEAYHKIARAISEDISCPQMAAPRTTNSAIPRADNRHSAAAPRESWTSHYPAGGQQEGEVVRAPDTS